MLFMLTAGAITCIITFIRRYTMVEKLFILLTVLVIFCFFGSLLKWTLDYFDKQNEKKRQEEGEVIEKEAAENGEESDGETIQKE